MFFDQKNQCQDTGKNKDKTSAKQQTKPLVRHKAFFQQRANILVIYQIGTQKLPKVSGEIGLLG